MGVQLYKLQERDIPRLLEIANEPRVLEALLQDPTPMREEDLIALLAPANSVAFAIAHEEEIVGAISLINVSLLNRSAEVANRIVASRCGWLVGLRAVREIISYGFSVLNLNRLYCQAHDDNTATHALCRKMGLHCEGIVRQAVWRKGKLRDVTVYSILKEEWDNGRN